MSRGVIVYTTRLLLNQPCLTVTLHHALHCGTYDVDASTTKTDVPSVYGSMGGLLIPLVTFLRIQYAVTLGDGTLLVKTAMGFKSQLDGALESA